MIRKKIAIACQGGGTHAAFTWGVLKEILETKKRWDLEAGDAAAFDITALSGTSAGTLRVGNLVRIGPEHRRPRLWHGGESGRASGFLVEYICRHDPD